MLNNLEITRKYQANIEDIIRV